MYYPYWVIESETKGKIVGDAEHIETWRSGNKRYTKKSTFRVTREGKVTFTDMFRSAVDSGRRRFAEGILPFNLKELVGFEISHLNGFQSEKKNLDRKDLEDSILLDVGNYTVAHLKSSLVTYSKVNITETKVVQTRAKWRYVLLPVWIFNCPDSSGEIRTYKMNGQNGKISGEPPLSKLKVVGTFFGYAISLSLIFTLVLWGIFAIFGKSGG